ncbi:MAG TPA: hypothetical protein VF812_12875 [Ktedonobacterales bacterium]
MEIPGVDSILHKSIREVWEPTERSGSWDLASAFDAIPGKFELGRFPEALRQLDKIPLNALQRSQAMRWWYLRGETYTGMEQSRQAFECYDQALTIATEASDLDSIVLLATSAGGALYDCQASTSAIDYYEVALDAWHAKAAEQIHPRPEPEVTLMTNLCRQLWIVGRFEDAQNKLAPALTLAMRARGVTHTPALDRMTANGLWMLSLILRSASDMRDGDGGYLNTAIRRMRQAATLKRRLGTSDYEMARLYIQLAELYLDLAEVHRLYGTEAAARPMRDQGFHYADTASEYLKPTTDTAAKRMAQMTLLRDTIMSLRPQRALPNELNEIESALTHIEHEAAALNDTFGVAKAATLRGEWLLFLGKPDMAREALEQAIAGLQTEGQGMATRAERLLRRVTNEPPPGGRWRPSGGPIPERLEDPGSFDLDDDARN